MNPLKTIYYLSAFLPLCMQNGLSAQTAPHDSDIIVAAPLSFGEVMPQGWLLEQMKHDLKDGIAGHFPAINKTTEHKRFVLHNAHPDNVPHLQDDANVRGWWSGEHEGYYNDGYFRCSWLTQDQKNKKAAVQRLKDILNASAEDGYIGIYSKEHRLPDSGPDGELWTQSRIFQALLAYYEATGDKSILQAVEKAVRLTMDHYEKTEYFSRPGAKDGGVSHGIGYFDPLEWLYRLTGNDYYRHAYIRLYRDYAKSDTRDLDMIPANLTDKNSPWKYHTPHTAEALALPLTAAAYGAAEYSPAAANVLFKVDKYMNPGGGLVGDEAIANRPGTFDLPAEYCSLTEGISSLNRMDIYQNTFTSADRIERIAFNAAQGGRLHPAATGVTYLSRDNRYETSTRHSERELFSPCHAAAACCALNSTRLLPYYIEGMWMKNPEQTTLYARLYGASRTTTRLNNTQVVIEEKTDYPFSDKIRFEVTPEKPVDFQLVLRIPTYIQNPQINTPKNMDVVKSNDSITLKGQWKKGDVVELNLNFSVRPVHDSKGNTGLAYGPLLFSLPIEAEESVVKTFPHSSFSNRLYKAVSPPDKDKRLTDISTFKAVKRPQSDPLNPWVSPPVELTGEMLNKDGEKISVTLVPMGTTILRQTGFKSK